AVPAAAAGLVAYASVLVSWRPVGLRTAWTYARALRCSSSRSSSTGTAGGARSPPAPRPTAYTRPRVTRGSMALAHIQRARGRPNEDGGFAGGSNAGMGRALERGADWVLLLNNDAVAEPGLRPALERAAAARPDAGILACKVLFEDGGSVMYAGASFNAWLG